MAQIELPPDFKEFLQLCSEMQIEYLLIGGYAVSYYGYPRATGDMDLWVASSPENAERLTEALRQFGFDTPDLSPSLFLEPDKIIRMGVPPMRLELLTSIDGVDFSFCYPHRKIAVVDGVPVSLISLADLRTNKKASARLKDLNDLANLSEE